MVHANTGYNRSLRYTESGEEKRRGKEQRKENGTFDGRASTVRLFLAPVYLIERQFAIIRDLISFVLSRAEARLETRLK